MLIRNLILIIVFSLVLFVNISFSQFYADSAISDYVVELFKIADHIKRDNIENDNSSTCNDSSLSDIETIAQLFYRVFDKDPVGYNEYLKQKFQKLNAERNLIELKPAIKIRRLKECLVQKYGIPFTEIIITPAFLRCKFLSLSSSYYKDGIRSADFNFIIEDVLKGDKYFKVGDIIIVRMLPDIECPSPYFQSGNSYLIPVTTNLGLGDNSFNIVFHYLLDNYNTVILGQPPKIFAIENEVVIDGEYMGFSEMKWQEFKWFFKEKYMIFN